MHSWNLLNLWNPYTKLSQSSNRLQCMITDSQTNYLMHDKKPCVWFWEMIHLPVVVSGTSLTRSTCQTAFLELILRHTSVCVTIKTLHGYVASTGSSGSAGGRSGTPPYHPRPPSTWASATGLVNAGSTATRMRLVCGAVWISRGRGQMTGWLVYPAIRFSTDSRQRRDN